MSRPRPPDAAKCRHRSVHRVSRKRLNTPAATRCGATPHGALAKSLAVALAGSKFAGHLVVLTCKFVGENRSSSNIKEQVCEKWTLTSATLNSLIPAKKSLFLVIFSLLICVGNYAKSDCGAAVSCYEIDLGTPEIAEFPVIFPVSRELQVETGSYLTTHTATPLEKQQ
jgi:hypothetical protein